MKSIWSNTKGSLGTLSNRHTDIMDRWNTEIQEEARRVLLLEKQREREEAERQKAAEAAAMAEREKRLQEERTLLIQREIEARLLAEKIVLEEEARRIAQEKEAALKAELERLRNRTPLEVLQDEVADLREQLAMALAEVDAMRGKAEKAEAEQKAEAESIKKADSVAPSDELLLDAWMTLVEWKAVQKELEAIQQQWMSNERALFKNPEYKASYGAYKGSSKVAYPVEAITEDHTKATEAMKALEARCMPHKAIWETARDDMNEKSKACGKAGIKKETYISNASDQARWEQFRSGSFQHSHYGHDRNRFDVYTVLQQLTWPQACQEKARIDQEIATTKAAYDAAVAVEAVAKKAYDAEVATWNTNQEKAALQKRINDLASLKAICLSIPPSLQRCAEKELELVTLERTLIDHLGTEDLETAYRNAVKAVRCARSA